MYQHSYLATGALSAFTGSVLSQLTMGLFRYYKGKGKYNTAVRNAYRDKKTVVAESYFDATAKTIAALKKAVSLRTNRNDLGSHLSMIFLSREMKKADEQLDRIDSENRKFGMINLYFKMKPATGQLSEAIQMSRQLYFQLWDNAEYTDGRAFKQNDLCGDYDSRIFALCNQYEHICQILAQDRSALRMELLQDFADTY